MITYIVYFAGVILSMIAGLIYTRYYYRKLDYTKRCHWRANGNDMSLLILIGILGAFAWPVVLIVLFMMLAPRILFEYAVTGQFFWEAETHKSDQEDRIK